MLEKCLILKIKGDRGAAASSYRSNSGWTLDGIIAGGPQDCNYSNMVRQYNYI